MAAANTSQNNLFYIAANKPPQRIQAERKPQQPLEHAEQPAAKSTSLFYYSSWQFFPVLSTHIFWHKKSMPLPKWGKYPWSVSKVRAEIIEKYLLLLNLILKLIFILFQSWHLQAKAPQAFSDSWTDIVGVEVKMPITVEILAYKSGVCSVLLFVHEQAAKGLFMLPVFS